MPIRTGNPTLLVSPLTTITLLLCLAASVATVGWRSRVGAEAPAEARPANSADIVSERDVFVLLMRRVDTDGDQRLSLAEFLGYGAMRGTFIRYDADANGYLDLTEMRTAVEREDPNLAPLPRKRSAGP